MRRRRQQGAELDCAAVDLPPLLLDDPARGGVAAEALTPTDADCQMIDLLVVPVSYVLGFPTPREASLWMSLAASFANAASASVHCGATVRVVTNTSVLDK